MIDKMRKYFRRKRIERCKRKKVRQAIGSITKVYIDGTHIVIGGKIDLRTKASREAYNIALGASEKMPLYYELED